MEDKILVNNLDETTSINTLKSEEFIGSKSNALFTRTCLGGVYDIYNTFIVEMIRTGSLSRKKQS